MSVRLTKDEAEVLRRHRDLSDRIANCGDAVKAVQLAFLEDAGLTEGLERGRLTLTMIARVARYLVRPVHPEKCPKKERQLVEDLADLPDFKAMGENIDMLKKYMLDSDTEPGYHKAKEEARRAASKAEAAKRSAP